MSIGHAYTHVLSSRERKALQHACDWLIESLFEDLDDVHRPGEIRQTTIGMCLPERYAHQYTPRFYRQFSVCLVVVVWKLAQPVHLPLSSLGEELAAWAVITTAKNSIEERHGAKNANKAFERFCDAYFEDMDFLFLFDDALDGIDTSPLNERLGIASLAFDDWFRPFSDEPHRIVHPFVLE